MGKRQHLASHLPSCPKELANCLVVFTHQSEDVGYHYNCVVYENDYGHLFEVSWSTEEGEEIPFDFKPIRITKKEFEELKLLSSE